MRKKKMLKKKGFTFIELVIGMIIVGVLVTIAFPFMHNARKRAILSEAIASLGIISEVQRAYYIENREYQNVGMAGIDGEMDGLFQGALDGTFFSENCYSIWAGGDWYWLVCCPDPNTVYGKGVNNAPKAADAIAIMDGVWGWLEMDSDGNISTTNISGSGYQ